MPDIGEDPPHKWDPKHIIHARLEMVEVHDSGEPFEDDLAPQKRERRAKFQVFHVPTDDGYVAIEDYAVEVANGQGLMRPPGKPFPTPWDVPVEKQCWILFELDPLITNWQFYGKAMVIAGNPNPKSYDFGLRHVMPGASKSSKGSIKGDGCRVIFFGVGERENPKYGDPSHHYNLLIEFLHHGGKRLPIIVDPDIPNGGSNTIP